MTLPEFYSGGPLKGLLTGLFAFGLTVTAPAEPASLGLFGSAAGMKGAVIAIYLGKESEPSSTLRVRVVRTEYQRRGFFRIGLLPMAVLEGVKIEVRDAQSLSNSLAHCQQWFGSRNARFLELRDVQLIAVGPSTNRLACGRARPAADGKWELLDGVTLDSEPIRTEAPQATLQVTGPSSGQLLLGTTPPSTNYFCATPHYYRPSGK
jgi:hypothetical protein